MTTRFPYTGPLNLRRTLGWLNVWGAAPWVRLDRDGGWVAQRTPDGPGTVHLWQTEEAVLAEAFGPGADRLLARVPDLAGLHDDPEVLQPHHPVVADLQKRQRGVRVGRSLDVLPTLVSLVVAQKVTSRASKAAVREMAWKWGEEAPGPRDDIRLLPPMEELAQTPYYAFHPLNIERRRADTIVRRSSLTCHLLVPGVRLK